MTKYIEQKIKLTMHHGYLYPHSAAAQTNYIRASDRVDTRKIKFRHKIVTTTIQIKTII